MALRTDAGATNASNCTLLTERSILVAFSLISNCTGDKLLSSDIVALYCVANWFASKVELDCFLLLLLIVFQKYESLRDWCKSFNLKWNWFRWPFTFCLRVLLKVFLTNLWQSYTAPDFGLPQEIQSWNQKRFWSLILLSSGHQKGLGLNFLSGMQPALVAALWKAELMASTCVSMVAWADWELLKADRSRSGTLSSSFSKHCWYKTFIAWFFHFGKVCWGSEILLSEGFWLNLSFKETLRGKWSLRLSDSSGIILQDCTASISYAEPIIWSIHV